MSTTNVLHSIPETKMKMSATRSGTGIGERNSQFGTVWITNGVENRKMNRLDPIPEGWYKGRKIGFEEVAN